MGDHYCEGAGMTEDGQGRIYIDGSREAQEELLSLCMERMQEFCPAEAGEYGPYFQGLFSYLCALFEGKEAVLPERPEDPYLSFWITEAGRLSANPCGRHFLTVCETSLLMLFMLREGEEIKEILYSYVYDYAEEFLIEAVCTGNTGLSLVTDFVFGESGEAKGEMQLFFGERLKARCLEALSNVKNRYPSEFEAMKGKLRRFPEGQEEGGHRMHVMKEFFGKAVLLFSCLLLSLSVFSGCGRHKKEEPEETETVARNLSSEYPGLCEVKNGDGEVVDIFGIMHALILDVQPGEKSGLFVYTLRDRFDPENAWSIESKYVGDIFADMEKGNEVSVLFSGNIVDDPDSVNFIAMVDDEEYKIKKAEGTIINNMMNSFTMLSSTGVELVFRKDNCTVDRDALSTSSKDRITVYYADFGSPELYPFRVYRNFSAKESK